jgi:hypothetical protein
MSVNVGYWHKAEWVGALQMSAYDPKRTSSTPNNTRYRGLSRDDAGKD